ncbi:MAG: FxLYD domain-containing protein [Candidatus Nitrosocosmicus sp.]
MVSIALVAILFPHSAQSQEQQGTVSHLADIPTSLKIDNIYVGDSPTGLIVVKGIVHNNSTENIVNVKVNVDLFDANNELIIETQRFITPASSIFKPGYERNFDFLVTAKDVDHYNISAFGENAQ